MSTTQNDVLILATRTLDTHTLKTLLQNQLDHTAELVDATLQDLQAGSVPDETPDIFYHLEVVQQLHTALQNHVGRLAAAEFDDLIAALCRDIAMVAVTAITKYRESRAAAEQAAPAA